MTFVYVEHLVERAKEAEEPVTEISREMDTRPLYHAVQEHDGTAWRVTIDTGDIRPEYDSTPHVTFARCFPDAEWEAMREWSSLATGRLSGPQSLPAWESLFTVFNAALRLYHDDEDGRETMLAEVAEA